MCYFTEANTRPPEDYVERIAHTPEQQQGIQLQLDELFKAQILQKYHFADGFAFPKLMVITNEEPNQIQAFHWGLIPSWVKDPKQAVGLARKTLNARAETIFEKPSFRSAAKSRRCLVVLDGFYEYHHHNGNTFPYRIFAKNKKPIVMAGLWETWRQEHQVRNTFSIVTTKANPLMAKIHNNPKLPEPRMPVILPKELEREWITPEPADHPVRKQQLQELLQPYDQDELAAHTVQKLKGKFGTGNTEEAPKEFHYDELPELFG